MRYDNVKDEVLSPIEMGLKIIANFNSDDFANEMRVISFLITYLFG